MKRIYWIAGILLGGLLFWGVFFFPVAVSKKVEVPYSMFRCGEQLNNPEAWKRWYFPFTGEETITTSKDKNKIQTRDYSLAVSAITMYSAVLEAGYKKKKKFFSFAALTDTSDVTVSDITLSYSTTLFRKWFAKTKLEKNAEKSLENLKDYMTDTRRFYGFEIQRVTVEDTAFLFMRKVVPLTERREATRKIYEKLIAYAENKKAGYNGTRIYYTLKSGNEITIFASIGVTNPGQTKPGEEVQYKRMPYGKNLLVTIYQGPFSGSEKAFKALEAFKKDHNLSSMAIPFQKFMSDGYDFADDQAVQLKVYYPVF
ncbi:MAG: hypothetical protein FJY20_11305 [Bacteroidetes bacterium]|nr:hypothetical protein [Bacteroidota bacterium]